MRLGRARTPPAWAALLLPLALAAWTVRQVALAYSPAPFGDYWATIGQWQAILQHGLTFSDLFAQHNEHRILFPRLVFFADLAWFQGRGVLDFAAIAAIQLLGIGFYVAAARDRGGLRPLGVLGLALAAALLVSLRQWENFFWAFQVQFVGVFVAGGWALWAFCRGAAASPPRWGQVLAGLLLLVVAAFSMANGALAGLAMAAVVLIGRRSPVAAAAALIATLALLAIYVVGFHHGGDNASAPIALKHPLWPVVYLLTYLGNIWGFGQWKLAFCVGAAGALSVAGMALVVFRDRGRDPGRMALLGMAIFIGLSAAITSLGRLDLGIGQALSSRYMTPSAHFWAAQALFWALTLQDVHAQRLKTAGASALVLCGLLLIPMQARSQVQMQGMRERILLASSALISGVKDDAALEGVYPAAYVPIAYAPFLRAQRLSVFAGAAAPRAGTRLAPVVISDARICGGAFDLLSPAADGAWRAQGWSWDGAAHRPFQRIVLADDAGVVLGDGVSGMRREDVARSVREVRTPQAGWIAALARGQGRQVAAYGLLDDGRVCELGRKEWPR